MPGPTIARASILVDLDGKRIPAEAALLGREAGDRQGEEHAKAYRERLGKDSRGIGDEVLKEMDSNGVGQRFGEDFDKGFRDSIKGKLTADAKKMQRDLADIFSNNDGIARFNNALQGTGTQLGGAERTASALRTELAKLHEVNGITDEDFQKASRSIDKWEQGQKRLERSLGLSRDAAEKMNKELDKQSTARLDDDLKRLTKDLDEFKKTGVGSFGDLNRMQQEGEGHLKTYEADMRSLKNATGELSPEMQHLHDEALRVNDEFNRTSAAQYAENLRATSKASDPLIRDVRNLRLESERLGKEFDAEDARMKRVGSTLTRDMDSAYRQVNGSIRRLGPDVESIGRRFDEFSKRGSASGAELRRLATDVNSAQRRFESARLATEHIKTEFGLFGERARVVTTDLERIGGTLGRAAGGFSKLGAEAEKSSGAIGRSRGRIGLWTGAIIALVAVVAALGPEISALGSAAGAFGVAAGDAAITAVVGFLALKDAVTGILAPIKTLPASIRPAAAAMQDFIGTINDKGKFAPSKFLQDLQTIFLSHAWQHMGGPIRDLAAALNGPLKESAVDVGNAIHKVTEATADFFALPAGASIINDFFNTLESLLPAVADAIGAAGGAMVQLFREAGPFTKDALSSLTDMLNGFTRFSHTVKGDKAIDDWFVHARIILGHVGTALTDVGIAFHNMVTPAAIHNLNVLLDGIGTTALSLGRFMSTLEPAALLISDTLTGIGSILDSLNGGLKALVQGIVDAARPVISLVVSISKILEPVLTVIGQILGGLFTLIGQALTALKPLINGLLGGLVAALSPLVNLIGTVLLGAFKAIGQTIQAERPIFDALGTVFLAIGQGIGTITRAVFGATGLGQAFDLISGKSGTFASLLKSLQPAFNQIAKNLRDFAGTIRNEWVPAIIAWLIPGVKKISQAFVDLVPLIGPLIDAIGRFAQLAIADFKLVVDAGGSLMTVFTDISRVLLDIGRLDWGAALRDGKKAMLDFGAAGKQLGADLSAAKQAQQDFSTAQDKFNAILGKVGPKAARDYADGIAFLNGTNKNAIPAIEAYAHALEGQAAAYKKPKQSVGDYIAALKKVPESVKTAVLEDAIKHHAPIAGYIKLLKEVRPSVQTRILIDAAQAITRVSDLQTLIKGIKDGKFAIKGNTTEGKKLIAELQARIDAIKQKQRIKLDADNAAGKAKALALQLAISAIKQGAKPSVAINNLRGLLGTKDLQNAINAIKQGKVPGLNANSAEGRAVVKALQAAINAIHQGSKPAISVNTGPASGTLAALQARINALHGRTVTVTTVLQTVNAGRRAGGAGQSVGENGGFSDLRGRLGLQRFADGGLTRDGMIAPGGANILWAEPQTGWEAYISGKAGQSVRNISTWMEAGRRLGVLGAVGNKTVNVTQHFTTPNADPQQVAAAAVDRLVPQL